MTNCFCEAWSITDAGVPTSGTVNQPFDFNHVPEPGAVDFFKYEVHSMAWAEPIGIPSHFARGIDDQDRITSPWGWAPGHLGWRKPPPGSIIYLIHLEWISLGTIPAGTIHADGIRMRPDQAIDWTFQPVHAAHIRNSQ